MNIKNSEQHILDAIKKHDFNDFKEDVIFFLKNIGESAPLTRLLLDSYLSFHNNSSSTKNKIIISVIIPCHNYGIYLRDAVLSVLHQTFPNFEIIIINDGSEDNSHSIATKILSDFSDHHISYINQPHSGIVQPRNRGVGMARGKYILPLDADDMIAPQFLEKTVNFLSGRPDLGYVSTKALFFGDVNKIWPREDFHPANLFVTNQQTNTTLYRKEMWENIGGYDERMIHGYMDWEFWIRATKFGWIGHQIDEPLFFYRRKSNSVVMKAKNNDVEIKTQIMKLHPEVYHADQADMNDPELQRKNWIPPRLVRKGAFPSKKFTQRNESRHISPSNVPVSDKQSQVILHVCHDFPPYKHAGAQLFALHLGKNQASQGHAPHFFYPVVSKDMPKLTHSRFDGLPVHETLIQDNENLFLSPQYAIANKHVEDHFATVLKEQNISIVHFHLLYRLSTRLPLISRKAGIPSFATVHDYWLLCAMGHLIDTRGQACSGPESPEKCAECLIGFRGTPDPRLVAFFVQREKATKEAYLAIDHVIAPSHSLANVHAQYGFPRPAVLPLGWLPVTPRHTDKTSGESLIFGYCGQIIYRKGLDVALNALRQVHASNWKFHIHGQIHDHAYFESALKDFQNDPRIKYLGPYSPDKLSEIYSSIDVSLIPSRRENYPLTLMEALSAKVPSIVTDVGGVREMIVDGLEGFIVPPDNSQAIANHLKRFIANPNLPSLLAKAIRPVKSITDNAAEYDAFYRFARGSKHANNDPFVPPVFLSNVRLAEHYLQRGDINKASKYCEKAAEILPDHPRTHRLKAKF